VGVCAENILLTDKNDVTSVLLTDFGISRCGDLPDMKLDGFGTPAYMAPELFGAKPTYTEAVRCVVFGVAIGTTGLVRSKWKLAAPMRVWYQL